MHYLDSFDDYLKKRDLSHNTIISYKSDVEQFLSYIDKQVNNIDKQDIENFKKHLTNSQLNVTSVNRKLIGVRSFLNFLNDNYNFGLSLNIKRIKQQNQQYLEDILNKEDLEKLICCTRDKKDKRAEALLNALYLTGMRVSEVLQLKVEDVDKSYVSIRGKGDKYRTIFIPPRLNDILKEYVNERIDDGDQLFTGQRGSINRQTVHNIIKKYASMANINMNAAHAHNFRHLYCLSLVEKGLPIDVVADLAGHSNINTTRIYTRKTKEQLMNAINDL